MSNPNLFIIGAPKAGTTFLYEKLKNHPDLFFTKIKEVNHFSYKELAKNSYYKDYKIRDRKDYLKNYSAAKEHKYLVDASVSYFAYPGVARKIYEFNPDAKILIMTRDPYKRAFSHYLMDRRMGYAKKPFINYIEDKEVYPAHYHQYINNSLYSKNIASYTEVFRKEQVFVMKLENLDNELSRLFQFLKIEDISARISSDEKINANKEAKNFLAAFFQKHRGVTERLKLIIPKPIINFGNSLLYKAPEDVKMTNDEHKVLTNLLGDELEHYHNSIK